MANRPRKSQTPPSLTARRDHIGPTEGASNQEKLEGYEHILSVEKGGKVKLSEKKGEKLTNSVLEKCRHDMVKAIVNDDKYKNNLQALDTDVLHRKDWGKTIVGLNSLMGNILTAWMRKHGISEGEVLFQEDDKIIRRADGHVKGTTLVEVKSSIARKPANQEKDQMRDYAAIIKDDIAGTTVENKKRVDVGPFTDIRYCFGTLEAARAWRDEIEERFEKNEFEIYVGKEPLSKKENEEEGKLEHGEESE